MSQSTVKITVIMESIERIENRMAKLDSLIYAKPLSEVIEVRRQGFEAINKHKGNHKKISELLEPLAKKEKSLMSLAKSQIKNDKKWIDEKVRIQLEHGHLINELYYTRRSSANQ